MQYFLQLNEKIKICTLYLKHQRVDIIFLCFVGRLPYLESILYNFKCGKILLTLIPHLPYSCNLYGEPELTIEVCIK